jgi:hypothetical protein
LIGYSSAILPASFPLRPSGQLRKNQMANAHTSRARSIFSEVFHTFDYANSPNPTALPANQQEQRRSKIRTSIKKAETKKSLQNPACRLQAIHKPKKQTFTPNAKRDV